MLAPAEPGKAVPLYVCMTCIQELSSSAEDAAVRGACSRCSICSANLAMNIRQLGKMCMTHGSLRINCETVAARWRLPRLAASSDGQAAVADRSPPLSC